MSTLVVCLILLAISYVNNDGNIKFSMTFHISEPNTFTFGFKHRELEYSVNNKHFETKYNDVDIAEIVNQLFSDSESLTSSVLKQMGTLTEQYIDALVEDITNDMDLTAEQRTTVIDEVRGFDFTTEYEQHINEIMDDINFGDELGVTESENDAFRFFEIPSMLVAASMGLCVLIMILISLMYFEQVPESCLCKCCTSFLCLFPVLVSVLLIGVAWIAMGMVYDAHVNINWDDAEQSLQDGLEQSINEYFANPINNELRNNYGINYTGWSEILIATLQQIGGFQDEVTVGTSPWFQAVAGLMFLMFSCVFCCCQTKKEDEGKVWEEGYGGTGGGDVEFGSHY